MENAVTQASNCSIQSVY